MSRLRRLQGLRRGMLMGAMAWAAASGAAQEAAQPVPSSAVVAGNAGNSRSGSDDSVRELREQVRELQTMVAGMRSEWKQARAETEELRREVAELRAGAATRGAVLRTAVMEPASVQSASQPASSQADAAEMPQSNSGEYGGGEENAEQQKKSNHAASLEEEYQLLTGKVDDQYQTKVESASKYRLRISGIVLMNLASTQGTVDSVDLPTLAYANPEGGTGGSFGATLRQSQIGFEVFGPTVAGARTRADLQLDLAGGFPTIPNGVNSGFVRLRTGTMRMDWGNTSVIAGQDGLFISPNSPTSFATLAIPALSYAGNLWSWTPQIRVEHRVVLGEHSSLMFQGGILDPLSGEVPPVTGTGQYRQAGPGEASRQPAYGSRVGWTGNAFGQPVRLGVGGYYNRQNYGFDRTLDGWAGTADVEVPFSHQVSLTGEVYRGRGVGGLYGGIGRSVLFSGNPALASSELRGLNAVGGWAQLKYRPASKLEFNAAFGMDNPYASDLKHYPYAQSYGDPTLARNLTSFVNMIYRPRSDLLFSAEYRHLNTYSINKNEASAGHLNLMMGVLF